MRARALMKHGTAKHLPPALFTMFWVAQTISLFGDRLSNFSLMALFNSFSGNPSLTLSYFYLAMSLPIYLLAPFIGAIVDRLDKRWILVVTDLARCGLVLLIPVLFDRTGHFFPIMAIVFLLATGNLFFLPAKSALIPELVARERLMRVNSILWGAGIAGVIGGFLGGGLIYDFLSWRACFWLDGASYFLSASLILGIAIHRMRTVPRAERNAAYHPKLPTAVLEGIRAIRGTPAIVRPIGVQTLIWLGAGGFSVLALPLIKEMTPPGTSMGLSLAGLALGLGMGLGSLVASRLHLDGSGRERIEMGLFCLIPVSSAVTALGRDLPTLLAGAFLGGLAATPLLIIAESEIQRESGERMRGRIFAFREICTRTLFIAAAFLFSWLAARAGERWLLFALGLFLAMFGILWIGMVSRRFGAGGRTEGL
jgi:predicted MFS family arabinose efflux permease